MGCLMTELEKRPALGNTDDKYIANSLAEPTESIEGVPRNFTVVGVLLDLLDNLTKLQELRGLAVILAIYVLKIFCVASKCDLFALTSQGRKGIVGIWTKVTLVCKV